MKRWNTARAFSRRDWLKLAMASGLVTAGIRMEMGTTSAASGLPILSRQIPSTGEMLPAVGLGTSDEFETADDLGSLREVLRRFVAMGGAVIDTAPGYGEAESVVGGLISQLGVGDELFVATKVSSYGEQAGLDQMEKSQRLLRIEPLDLIEVHSLVDVETQLENLRRWKDLGRVRYIGITHHDLAAHDELERLMRTEKLDFVQFNYSVSEPQAEQRLLPLAANRGIAVLTNRPFENGELFSVTEGKPLPVWTKEFDCESWAQFSLKYVLAHPAVTCVIPATSNPKHVVDNMRAGLGRLPDERMRARMRGFAATL
ncbi:MAG: aldo/keto reductase [Pseudomonadota bacterium]|nr:aldo/keto reductase [Pseudomonadota bacterium]